MPIRLPAVAGRFYPGNPAALSTMIESFIDRAFVPSAAIGVVVPHAGYIYSGHVAGAVYTRVAVPSRTIILCPNHTGFGVPLSIMSMGSWQTPVGDIQIDNEMAIALMAADPDLEEDSDAHRQEHAIEVQLPFLQHVLHRAGTRFVPITVGVSGWDALERLGKAIAEAIQRVDSTTLIIASSDMNHYESDAITRMKDARAIDPLLKLDARGLHEIVRREKISMCGVGPATSMIVASRILGATQADLVKYATSADVSKDFTHVVGYAGVIVS
jgi:AmmeMemoRadiSam system protein B